MIRATDTFEAAKANVAGILIGLSLPSAVAVIAPMYSEASKSGKDGQATTRSPDESKSPR